MANGLLSVVPSIIGSSRPRSDGVRLFDTGVFGNGSPPNSVLHRYCHEPPAARTNRAKPRAADLAPAVASVIDDNLRGRVAHRVVGLVATWMGSNDHCHRRRDVRLLADLVPATKAFTRDYALVIDVVATNRHDGGRRFSGLVHCFLPYH